MDSTESKYKSILKLLRESGPLLENREEIENGIIKRINLKQHKAIDSSDIFSFLFGWVYIGWVRKSLVAVAAVFVLIFIFQQATILREVKHINSQEVVVVKSWSQADYAENPGNILAVFRLTRQLNSPVVTAIPEKDIKQLIESYEILQTRYSRLINIIEEDPELKNYIEMKLNQEKIIKSDI